MADKSADPEAEPVLRHALGPVQLFTLGFGAILGAGWVVALGQWVALAGPWGTALGFLGGTFIISLVALCYADLGARYPSAGGELVYAEQLFGQSASFFTGWMLAVIYLGVAAFEAISIGWIAEVLWPQLSGPRLYVCLGHEVHLLGLLSGFLCIALVAFLNFLGAHATSRGQDFLTLILIVTASVFIAAGFVVGHSANLTPAFVQDVKGRSWPGVLAVFVTAPFWLSGFGAVCQGLGEQRAAAQRRRLSIVLLLAINVSCLFYVLVVFAASYAVPRDALLSLPLPAAGAFEAALHSHAMAQLVLITGLLGLLLALNAIFYAATRVLLALGSRGMLPRQLGRVELSHGSPPIAIAAVTLAVIIGTLLGRGAIGPLVDSTSIAVSGIYLLICLGTWCARTSEKADIARLNFRYLALPASATLLTFCLLIVALIMPWWTSSALIPPEIAIFMASLLVGMLIWLARRHRTLGLHDSRAPQSPP